MRHIARSQGVVVCAKRKAIIAFSVILIKLLHIRNSFVTQSGSSCILNGCAITPPYFPTDYVPNVIPPREMSDSLIGVPLPISGWVDNRRG